MKEIVYQPFDGLKIFVMNVEALSTPRGTKAAYAFLAKNPANMVVVTKARRSRTARLPAPRT